MSSLRATISPETAEPLERSLRVQTWRDPVIDDLGFDPRSRYVERFWLPVLGPSTLLLLRRMAEELDAAPGGFELHLADAAGWLGLGVRGGRQQPLLRAVDRACTFGAARLVDTTTLSVRRRLAPLGARQVQRLIPPLQTEHARWLADGGEDAEVPAGHPDPAEQRARARSLALSLLQLGETVDDTERQLHRWRFHPAMTHEAIRWAEARLADGTC